MAKTLEVMKRAGAPTLLLVALLGASSALATYPPGTVFRPTEYAGRATVVNATLNLLTSKSKLVVADTGFLDTKGGTEEDTVLTVDNPPPLELHSQTAHAITSGQNDIASSTASVQKLVLKIPNLTITADVLEANSYAQCDPTISVVTTKGSSSILNLKINGNAVPASAPPNTKIVIPGVATIIINEQSNPDVNTQSVNALHVIVPGVPGVLSSDIIIAHAESGILACRQPLVC